jgi:hypothetical protein
MAGFLERLRLRSWRRAAALPDERTLRDGRDSLDAALAEAEILAAHTSALARDLHRLLARGIARRRALRAAERVLH